jgi:hypothetical protein
MSPDERAVLGKLDELIELPEAVEHIQHAIAIASQKLAADPSALLSWEPIPISVYGPDLPRMIKSSWVFILRSRCVTGAERHPNSHQRMASYIGSGDFQVSFQSASQADRLPLWDSNYLSSGPAADLYQKWVSIPPNTWHQAVTGEQDWVVVSFHTAPEAELIEERLESEDTLITHNRTYLD